MSQYMRRILSVLPLAQAVLVLWQTVLSEPWLEELWQRHRGRAYSKKISFPLLLRLLAAALCQYRGSGRASFAAAQQRGELPASVVAAYGKLRRLPLPVSEALVTESAGPLRQLYPARAYAGRVRAPHLVAEFAVIVVDGKVVKNVPRRLKVTRAARGGLLGGRALVAVTMRDGLAVALVAHPDGEINEVQLHERLVTSVRAHVSGPRLWVEDRQFCDLVQPALLAQSGDQFLIRWHRRLHFQRDRAQPARHGRDTAGRPWVEDWGWLGRPGDPRRCYVRRRRLRLSATVELVLVTSLLDPRRYPAPELLALYRGRWNIEQVYQEVTEVFGLQRLIGSSPAATVFQLAFCLVLYNLLQVVRAYIAEGAARRVDAVSIDNLFQDVTRQLITWTELCPVAAMVRALGAPLPVAQLRPRLREWLGGQWRDWWEKTPPQKRRVAPRVKRAWRHTSVHRLIQAHRRQQNR